MKALEKKARVLVLGALLLSLASSCATIQPFQKKFLNDSKIQLSARRILGVKA